MYILLSHAVNIFRAREKGYIERKGRERREKEEAQERTEKTVMDEPRKVSRNRKRMAR